MALLQALIGALTGPIAPHLNQTLLASGRWPGLGQWVAPLTQTPASEGQDIDESYQDWSVDHTGTELSVDDITQNLRGDFIFAGDPFKGVDVAADGRQVVNQPIEINDFDIATSQFGLSATDLLFETPPVFVNGSIAALTASGISHANWIVVQDPFANAGEAATAIANTGVASGAGVFVYFNQSLQINRLVYSADLSDPTADISILANIRSLTGEAALQALPNFTAANFVLGGQVIVGDEDANLLLGTVGEDSIDGGAGDNFIDGRGSIDQLAAGGDGNTSFGVSGDPFQGGDVSAAGRQVVNQPNELLDFEIANDRFALDMADLNLGREAVFVNGSAEDLATSGIHDANQVVIQGSFANAGEAATAIANTGVASGAGVFVYFNQNLQINRLVYSADLGSADADISVVANIRTLTGDEALGALDEFTAANFLLLDQSIFGDADANLLVGGAGNDLISSGSGNDVVVGGGGSNIIFGGAGHDIIFGNFKLSGRSKATNSANLLAGGDGDDIIFGGRGSDRLFGGNGHDILLGGAGNDLLRGGPGRDSLIGGRGRDTFVIGSDEGDDTILDFKVGTDLIGLAGGLSLGQLTLKHNTISFGDETLAILSGVNVSTLGADSFVAL